MAKDPQQVAQDWANKLGASGDKVKAGVLAVRTAPGAAAARQVQVYVSNVAANAAKYARNVAAVGLGDWQGSTIDKGIPRLGTGATAAIPKMASFLAKFLPYLDTVKASLPPRGSYEANKARMIAMVDGSHKFQK